MSFLLVTTKNFARGWCNSLFTSSGLRQEERITLDEYCRYPSRPQRTQHLFSSSLVGVQGYNSAGSNQLTPPDG